MESSCRQEPRSAGPCTDECFEMHRGWGGPRVQNRAESGSLTNPTAQGVNNADDPRAIVARVSMGSLRAPPVAGRALHSVTAVHPAEPPPGLQHGVHSLVSSLSEPTCDKQGFDMPMLCLSGRVPIRHVLWINLVKTTMAGLNWTASNRLHGPNMPGSTGFRDLQAPKELSARGADFA